MDQATLDRRLAMFAATYTEIDYTFFHPIRLKDPLTKYCLNLGTDWLDEALNFCTYTEKGHCAIKFALRKERGKTHSKTYPDLSTTS